jgi:hypothetical protein
VTPERGPDGKFLSSDSDQDDATPDTTQDNARDPLAQDADTAPQPDGGDDLARDDDGGLIDPPTIPSFERELAGGARHRRRRHHPGNPGAVHGGARGQGPRPRRP